MDTLRKVLLAFGAIGVVMVLAAGPAFAAEGGGGETTTETTDEGAEDDHGGESLIIRNEEGKMVLPLDPNRPRDAVGWGLIGALTIALLLGAVNAVKQLRGERPQASGEWRYR